MKYGEGVMSGGKPEKARRKIGVFDSTASGLSVANDIQKGLSSYDVIYATDQTHIPYNTKTPKEIYGYVLPIFRELISNGCRVIVIISGAITPDIIGSLRQAVNVPIINMGSVVNPPTGQSKIDNASLEDIIQAARRGYSG